MKYLSVAVISIVIFCSCEKNPSKIAEFSVFERQFQNIEFVDTIDSREKGWAEGSLYEVKSSLLVDSLFYNFIDTSKLTYKRWDERLYAEGKIQLDENRTAFFISRQYEDITYDRTTLLLIFNKAVFEKDILFSEFVGYESAINETQSKLFKDEKGNWTIIRRTNSSYYDMEMENTVENSETTRLEKI